MDPDEHHRLRHRHLLDQADAECEHTRRELRSAYRDLAFALAPLLLVYAALWVFRGWREMLLAIVLTVVVGVAMTWWQARKRHP